MTKKEFRVSELELVLNKQHLDSWAVAHLFYGVPRKFKKVRVDIEKGGLIFFN